jgi:2-desacetyl-2-hydroxyethyl bacteriochlorophyllide A dehydrogenase
MKELINIRAVFPAPNEVILREEEVTAEMAPNEVRIRTLYSLISPGTELALLTRTHIGFSKPETHPWVQYPFSPGYAAVGEIEAVGAAVTGLSPGDRVFYPGRHQLYGDFDPTQTPILPVAAETPLPWLPFARLAQIANSAAYVSEVHDGQSVAVIGLGLVGNLAAQICREHGAQVIAADLMPFRRRLAGECGIAQTVAAEEEDAIAAVRAWTGGGADIVIEATGSPALVTPALQMVRPRGQVILLGSSRGTAEIDVYTYIHRPAVSVRGAHETVLPLIAEDGVDRRTVMAQMLQWIAEKRLIVEPLISQIVQPEAVAAAYRDLQHAQDSNIGILIDWRSL